MTSKEALEMLRKDLAKLLKIDNVDWLEFAIIKQDLERLEVLEKDLQDEINNYQEMGRLWHESEKENEKLKMAIEILKDHVQFKLVPIVSNDPILEGAYHFGIKIDKYGYYATLPKIEAELLKEVLGE